MSALLAIVALALSVCDAAAAESQTLPTPTTPAPRIVSLSSAIDLALTNNGDLAAKLTGLQTAQAHEALARAAAYPKVIGQGILSPIYESRGDALHSTNNLDRWGAWLQSTVTILQPFYTWGKLTDLREAAKHGTEVARAQARKDSNDTVYAVKELFYGATLAEQAYGFLEDGKKDIDALIVKAEADQQKKRPTIAKREFFRLKIFATEAGFRFEEAKKLRFLARHALSLNLGFDPEEETLPQDTMIAPIDGTPPSENALVDLMMNNRPEFAQLVHGIAAKQALLEAEHTNMYPMFFVGGLLSFAYSNVRDSQQSSYANDPYNRQTGGAGVGFQWTWDFATTLANMSGIRAEIDELEKKRIYARAGLRLELKKTLADLDEARYRVNASRDAFQIGKRWLTSESMGYSLGLGEVKNLIDAYLARAKTATDHWDAIYRLDMAWASLTRSVGIEITPGLAVRGTGSN